MQKVLITVPLLIFSAVLLAQEDTAARLVAQTGSGRTTSAAFSPDGRLFATGDSDGITRIWDTATQLELRRLSAHTGEVTSIAFSPDGRVLATGSSHGVVRLSVARTGEQIHSLRAHNRDVSFLAFLRNGRQLFGSYSSAGFVSVVWDVRTGKAVAVGPLDGTEVVGASGDGRRIVWCCCGDAVVRVKDVTNDGKPIEFRGHTTFKDGNSVLTVALSKDGTLALSGGKDKTARLWNVKAGRELNRFSHPMPVSAVAFSPDGMSAVTGADDGIIRYWNLKTGLEHHRVKTNGNTFRLIVSSPNGNTLLASTDKKMGTEYANETCLWEGSKAQACRSVRSYGSLTNFTISDDGALAVSLAGRTASIWDVTTGHTIHRLVGYSRSISWAEFSTDGKLVLIGAADKKTPFEATTAGTNAAATQSGDYRLWNVTTGLEIGRFRTLFRAQSSTDWRNSNLNRKRRRFNLVWTKERQQIVEVGTKRAVEIYDGGNADFLDPSAIRFAPDESVVLIGFRTIPWLDSESVGFIAVNVRTGKSVFRHYNARTAFGRREIGAVAFSNDGRLALTGGSDGRVRVWNVAKWIGVGRKGSNGPPPKELLLEGHAGAIVHATFSADDRLILTGSEDGTIKIWEAATGRLLVTRADFDDGSWALFDPDGRYDASDPDRSIGMHWVVGNTPIEVGQLKERYYTNRLLGRLLRNEHLPEVVSIQKIPPPPVVEVVGIDDSKKFATVRVRGGDGGVGPMRVRVNNKDLKTGLPQPNPQLKTQELTIDLSGAVLNPEGRNIFEVRASDAIQNLTSPIVETEWQSTPMAATRPPRLYAVVVGASEYQSKDLELKHAAKDAQVFASALTLGAKRLFGTEQTHLTLLTTGVEQKPSKQALQEVMRRIASEASPNDTLLIYFAGHGVSITGQKDRYYYLLPEARSTTLPNHDPPFLDLVAVSSGEIGDWMWKISALKQVLILDTCAAGAAMGELIKLAERRQPSADQRRAMELLKDSTGTHILMGSAGDAVSYEANAYGGGLLTIALLDGMSGNALEDGGRVDVRKLFDYAQRHVEGLARGIGGIQRPEVSSPKGKTFPIGLLEDEDRRAIPIAVRKPQVLPIHVLGENDLDRLQLGPALRRELRAKAMMPRTALAEGMSIKEVPFVYLDAVADAPPGALRPQVKYTRTGEGFQVRLRLIDESTQDLVSDKTFQGSADILALSRAIVEIVEREVRLYATGKRETQISVPNK